MNVPRIVRPVLGRPSWWRSARAVMHLAVARVFTPPMVVTGIVLMVLPMLFGMAFVSRNPSAGSINTVLDSTVPFLIQRYDQLVLALATPLVALLLSARTFSAEADDGTLLYLVTTATPRWWIVLTRVLFAAVGTAVVSCVAIAGTGAIVNGWSEPEHLTRAFVAGAAVGSVAYASLFTALALFSRRALVSGLLYIVVWENLLSQTFPALNYAGVRHWMIAVARALTTATDSRLESGPSATFSLVAVGVLAVLAVVAGSRRLATPRIGRIGT